MRRALLMAALVLGCGAAVAQDEEPRKIAVNAVKNPEMRSYRAIWRGMDEFEDQRALAPAARELRFKAIVRRGGDTPDEPLQARLASDEHTVLIAVDPDGRFTVPRDKAAYDARADLLLNRKKRSFRIQPDVRSPGLPDNVRRLGDLRLECKVMVAVAKEEAPFWIVAAVNSLLLTGDWCAKLDGDSGISFKTDAALASAVLTDGERSLPLKVSGNDYRVPVGSKEWPDDALVKLEFAP